MNSKRMRQRLSAIAVLAALSLSACGGDTDPVDTGQTATVTGVITGFGSIFVNGVEYETDGASVSVEGAAGSEEQLAIGMVVTLEGTVNPDGTTGTATAVHFADEVEGVVVANNLASGGNLDVMGQIVIVDASTQFESAFAAQLSPADIAVNNVVEVSGYSSGNGTIYATRIEVKDDAWQPGDEIEVKGIASSVDPLAQTFALGGLVIDYSQAQLEDGEPVDGWYVEVKSTAGLTGNLLVASKVEKEGDQKGLVGAEGEETELEGVITGTAERAEGIIELNGQRVAIRAETEYEHGTVDDLIEGRRVEIEGVFDADGLLLAHEIAFREEASIELRAQIQSVDVSAKTVTVLGQAFQVNNLTTMEDEQDEGGVVPVRYFSLADLRVGDTVEIHAYRGDANALVAKALRRDDPHENPGVVALEGPVEDASSPGLITLAGVTVDLSLTGGTFNDGDHVAIHGTFDGATLTALSADLEE